MLYEFNNDVFNSHYKRMSYLKNEFKFVKCTEPWEK